MSDNDSVSAVRFALPVSMSNSTFRGKVIELSPSVVSALSIPPSQRFLTDIFGGFHRTILLRQLLQPGTNENVPRDDS